MMEQLLISPIFTIFDIIRTVFQLLDLELLIKQVPNHLIDKNIYGNCLSNCIALTLANISLRTELIWHCRYIII